MRIQHNIMAMNAYRNYTNNTSALSKNLEKLSSGYKINRAGDDAAGLAISEKMRAQITGLNKAQDNAKDGISLVQTAEGALTEVHDMLNRMVELATQSANGTYDNEVDRANLQKEVLQLQEEIDRIAESANFNGIKLLDGSLADPDLEISSINLAGVTTAPSVTAATGAEFKSTIAAASAASEYTLTVQYATADGQYKTLDIKYTGSTTQADNAAAVRDALADSELASIFDIGGTGNDVTMTSKVTGENGAKILGLSTTDGTTVGAVSQTANTGTNEKLVVTGTAVPKAGDHFTLNGITYELIANADAKPTIEGATAILVGADATETTKNINSALSATGITVTNAGNTLTFEADPDKIGLTLQVGDTSDDYNKITVSVQAMDSKSLGIGSINIGTQQGAADAIDKIKTAINTVSSVRGDLGATQNRLDHTINNLSVMEENIQDAESSIRDTDVAEEMMAYTKNNILIQSAQAMLAQANQVPQGVLQLLQ